MTEIIFIILFSLGLNIATVHNFEDQIYENETYSNNNQSMNNEERFSTTQDIAQDSVIYISQGWTGGMGEAVLNMPEKKIKMIENYPVYFDDSSISEYKINNTCKVIKVEGNFTLTKKTSRNSSIRPDENGNFPMKTYFDLTVNSITKVEGVEGCK